ncbi:MULTISPECIES: hypothetical protein [Gordonia]|uniref:hypothetical protein n=1 Tax=Gordonia TaxID=2053 RepID=UPI00257C5ED8|nr:MULTISPECIES: hypothetical protein [Gordonia]
MPKHIDLYAIYSLDRRAPSPVLAQHLSDEINAVDPRDALTRTRIDTARVILGDPQRRARYDAQLADPSAPVIDERTLAALSGRPAPSARPSGQQAKILTGIAALVAAIIVIGVVAVACSRGGGDDNGGGDKTTTAASQAPEDDIPSGPLPVKANLYHAAWDETVSRTPLFAVRLTKAIQLPAEFRNINGGSKCLDSANAANGGIAQVQGGDIAVTALDAEGKGVRTDLWTYPQVKVSADGKVGPVAVYDSRTIDAATEPFDLAEESQCGYYRIDTTTGISIPADAKGVEPEQVFATLVLPDAYNKKSAWVSLRGHSDVLYQAEVIYPPRN